MEQLMQLDGAVEYFLVISSKDVNWNGSSTNILRDRLETVAETMNQKYDTALNSYDVRLTWAKIRNRWETWVKAIHYAPGVVDDSAGIIEMDNFSWDLLERVVPEAIVFRGKPMLFPNMVCTIFNRTPVQLLPVEHPSYHRNKSSSSRTSKRRSPKELEEEEKEACMRMFLFSFCVTLSPFRVVLFPLTVGYSEIKRTSPSVAFLFAQLGALVESFSDPLGAFSSSISYLKIEGFVYGDSGLGLVLGDLYPLLHKSHVWFKSVRGVLRRENMGSEVRSSDLERSSSSNVGGEGAGEDTATSAPSHVPSFFHPPTPVVPCPFHALQEKYSLKIEVFNQTNHSTN
uniref:Uncharacterized protein n=1 Tax=Quercus lobata TaxID=97700 RepID=A0A7N2N652_QUELO